MIQKPLFPFEVYRFAGGSKFPSPHAEHLVVSWTGYSEVIVVIRRLHSARASALLGYYCGDFR
jgi:hypothetical protein